MNPRNSKRIKKNWAIRTSNFSEFQKTWKEKAPRSHIGRRNFDKIPLNPLPNPNSMNIQKISF